MDRMGIGQRIVELARIAVAAHLESERAESELSRQQEATGGAGDRRLTDEASPRGGEWVHRSPSYFGASWRRP